MDEIITDVNKKIEKEGKKFADQSKEAIGDVSSFFSAVDFSERWIQGLILVEVILLLVIIVFRKRLTVQFSLLFSMIGIGALAERINTFAAQHWKTFSNVNYFDKSGKFISLTLSGPIVILSMVALVNIIYALFQLVVKVKQGQMNAENREQKKKKD